MANITLHNVKQVFAETRDHDTFCTLHLGVFTKSEYDNEPVYEKIDFFFDTIEQRQEFIASIANATEL